jgi:hypothetical protein
MIMCMSSHSNVNRTQDGHQPLKVVVVGCGLGELSTTPLISSPEHRLKRCTYRRSRMRDILPQRRTRSARPGKSA